MTPLRPPVAKRVAWSPCALAVALSLALLPLFVAVTRAAAAAGTPLPPAAAAQLQASALGWLETLGASWRAARSPRWAP
jgi:hypothetical protein